MKKLFDPEIMKNKFQKNFDCRPYFNGILWIIGISRIIAEYWNIMDYCPICTPKPYCQT